MTADGGLTVLAPLAIEQAALKRALPGTRVIRTGMGPDRARASAERLPVEGSPVAVAGFCGALAPAIEPGDVVVATEVRGPGGRTIPCSAGPLVAALRRMGVERLHHGPVVCTDTVVRGTDRTALAGSGAVAADMES